MRTQNKVLAIDDDRLVRLSIQKMLEAAGYNVIAVASGEEALEIFANNEFDLILTDIRMPGMSGLETLRALRQLVEHTKRRPLPEIVLTAYNDQHVIEEAKKMGVKEFLLKPFDADDFLDSIKKHLPYNAPF